MTRIETFKINMEYLTNGGLFIFLSVTSGVIMLVFHSLAYFLRYLLKFSNKRCNGTRQHNSRQLNGRYNFPSLDFMPAHRINAVKNILIQEKWRGQIERIVEYGCGSLEMFKEIEHIIGITDIMIIDTDEMLLETYKSYVTTKDIHKCWHRKLTSSLSVGSIGDPDSRTQGAGAVLAIEIIQNLYPDVLEAVPYNVFGFIQPKLAIFTTTNADFNVVFPNLEGFRSEDHKFEWTREQFECWALNICVRFPNYYVNFKGVGAGLEGTEHLGCCTQMAVFERRDFAVEYEESEVPRECRIRNDNFTTLDLSKVTARNAYSYGICTYCSYTKQINRWELRATDQYFKLPCYSEIDESRWLEYINGFGELEIWNYKMIMWIEFSKNLEDWTIYKQLLQEAENLMIIFPDGHPDYADDVYEDHVKIPLFKLISNQYGQYTTIPEIMKVLHRAKYVIEERTVVETGKNQLCVIRPRMRQPGSVSTSEGGEDTDEDFWSSEQSQHMDESSTITGREKIESEEQTNNITINHIIDNILINVQNRPEEPIIVNSLTEQNTNEVKENINDVCEGNLEENVIIYGKVKLDSEQNGFSSAGNFPNAGASTSQKSRVEIIIPNNKEITELKSFVKTDIKGVKSKYLNYDENENNMAHKSKLPEHKFTKSNVRDALLKITSNIETNNKFHNNKREPVAGTSKSRKRGRVKKIEAEEDNIKEDIKTLTQCIIYNSLNRVESNQNEQLIREQPIVIPLPPIPSTVDNNPQDQPAMIEIGNKNHVNDIVVQNSPVMEHVLNNTEVVVSPGTDKNGNVGNNLRFSLYDENRSSNETSTESGRSNNLENSDNPELSLNYASVEALFDPNSETDMLEDLDMPHIEEPVPVPALPNGNVENQFIDGQNVVVIGVRVNADSAESVALPQNADPFPNWLLQLLGANVLEESEAHDEPHFYCQGDGIGVHPSIVEVDIEEELSSSESSTSNDDAAENTFSENELNQFVDDIPFEDIPDNDDQNIIEAMSNLVIEDTVPPTILNNNANDSTDEFYDTIDEPHSFCSKCPCPNNPTGSFVKQIPSSNESNANQNSEIVFNINESSEVAHSSENQTAVITTPCEKSEAESVTTESQPGPSTQPKNSENVEPSTETYKDIQEK